MVGMEIRTCLSLVARHVLRPETSPLVQEAWQLPTEVVHVGFLQHLSPCFEHLSFDTRGFDEPAQDPAPHLPPLLSHWFLLPPLPPLLLLLLLLSWLLLSLSSWPP